MFTKGESRAVIVILLIIGVATFFNLRISLRKARDAQRKADIRSLYDALNQYEADFGYFPKSSQDGKILACAPVEGDRDGDPIFSPCEWYKDSLRDVFDDSYPPYLKVILGDPRQGQGRSYYYVSSGANYQIYASLESSSEDEFEEAIDARGLPCGQYRCNFGRSNGRTPLDKDLFEYESELRQDTAN